MTGRQILGGTWNMERDRPKGQAVASALAMMHTRELTFLCIQECAGYLPALRDAARSTEVDVIAFASDPGRAESAILVRKGHHGPGWQARATRSGWITVRGGRTPPKYLTIVEVDQWLKVVSGHTAPSVRWRGGRILGPARRVLSMRQFARSVVRLARKYPGPLLVAGDWNATPSTRGRWSPRWIARKTGMRIAAPVKPTHGNRTIDFALIRDCATSATREKRRGSDHHAVVFKVTP